jgi:Xaa-Pro aminopeptidase
LQPSRIGLNYSPEDPLADGLRHGLYLLLREYLEGTPHAERLEPAEEAIIALFAQKTPSEVERLKAAIATTDKIWAQTFAYVRPGMSERQIADFMHGELAELGVEAAWNYNACPIVNAGADAPVGHAEPGDTPIQPGQILHIDFGVRQEGYCSDVQRVAYLLAGGESQAPEPVRRAFEVVRRSVQEAVAKMRPGVAGSLVDAAAREVVTSAGYPEYVFATGHPLGRHAHDAGGILGPKWERYGSRPDRPLRAGEVYTVEPSVVVPGYGIMGLEEDVIVTAEGASYLTDPQKTLILIRA